jgi:hypothetical protein
MGFLIGDSATFATWGALRSVINNGEGPGAGYSFNVEYATGLYPTDGYFIRAWNTPRTFFGQPSLQPLFSGGYQLIAGGINTQDQAQIVGETATFDTSETRTVTTDAFTGGQSFTPTVAPSYVLSLGKFTRIT